MMPLLERIGNGEVLVGDGAMGTMLFERGLKSGECPERWNLEYPDQLEEIARLYFDAGAQIIETNTFGGSALKLAHYDLDRDTEQINAAAVRAVRRAVGDKAYVSASCGPTGCMLKPYGDTDPEEMTASFDRQLKSALDAGADLVCIETMTDLTEATLAIQSARNLSSTIPICATMTFDPTPKGFFTIMGVSIEQAANRLADAGADIVGSNCGNGIENMILIAQEFRKHTSLPLIIQSNAGLPEIKDGRLTYGETPGFMAEKSRQLLDIGVNIIGGCCGTTPAHVAAIREMIDQR